MPRRHGLLGAPLEAKQVFCTRGEAMAIGTGQRHLCFARFLARDLAVAQAPHRVARVYTHFPALGTRNAPIPLAVLGRHLISCARCPTACSRHQLSRLREGFAALGAARKRSTQLNATASEKRGMKNR